MAPRFLATNGQTHAFGKSDILTEAAFPTRLFSYVTPLLMPPIKSTVPSVSTVELWPARPVVSA